MFSCIAETPGRSEYLYFATPYASSPIVIFSRREVSYIPDIGNLGNKKVAVVNGYAIHETLVKEHPELTIVTAQSVDEALHLVESGDAFAYVGSLLVASHYITEGKHVMIKVAGETPYELSLSMATRSRVPGTVIF